VKHGGEQGSALLIVFVFAAMVAIMLYMEMPVAVFEAKRQKEQLLVDRGEEYAHAVRLFVRKTGHYPASLDQLEDTNRMRFLRHRFKDPFTGKDDWRLLHAGPGGMLVDSKIKPVNTPGAPGQTPGTNSGFGSSSGFGSNSGFGSSSNSNSNSGFGSTSNANSGFGSSSGFGGNTATASANSNSGFGASGSFGSSSSSTPDTVVPPVPQRAPAVKANAPATDSATGAADTGQDPTVSLVPSEKPDQLQAGATAQPNGTPAAGTRPNGAAANAAPGPGGRLSAGNGAQPFGASGNGVISGGGIAGVASKAAGESIKVINDQTDYSLWEFFYDPRKDLMRGAGAMAPGGLQTGAPANAPQNTNGAFGSNSPSTMAPQNSAPQNSAPQGPVEGTAAGPQQEPQQEEPQEPQQEEPQGPQQPPE